MNPRPWPWCLNRGPLHAACFVTERLWLRTGRRTRTLLPGRVLDAALALRAAHPEPHFPLRAALAWRFGVSEHAIRKALATARRTR